MADESPKLKDVDKLPQLKTGIAELDEVLSGTERRELHIFTAAIPKTTLAQAVHEAWEKGSIAVSLDLEMDDPPDKANTPKPGS